MPFQTVIKADHSTTKVRIVYDASSKTVLAIYSLNDCLWKGPPLLNNLTGILLRTRSYETLLLGDIEKAFLQIEIRPEDRDAVRFFWLTNPKDPIEPFRTYRFTRVAFGLTSSPSHLAATIQHHLQKTDSPLAKEVNKNLYVDNVILGLYNGNEVSGIVPKLKALFKDAGMNIR